MRQKKSLSHHRLNTQFVMGGKPEVQWGPPIVLTFKALALLLVPESICTSISVLLIVLILPVPKVCPWSGFHCTLRMLLEGPERLNVDVETKSDFRTCLVSALVAMQSKRKVPHRVPHFTFVPEKVDTVSAGCDDHRETRAFWSI